MATETKKGLWAKFINWYESYNGKRWTAIVYSLGASVVIIGALGKIMHYSWAPIVLPIGMGIEAFLFALGCLDKPHPEFHWEEVFPQLLGYGTDPEILAELEKRPRPTLLNGNEAAPAASASVPAMDAQPMSAGDMKSLKEGIANMSKVAEQMADLGKAAAATAKFGEKAEVAAEAADKFAQAAGNLEGAVAGSKAYKDAMEAAGKHAAAFSADIEKIHAAMAEAAKANAEYEAASKKLAKQVSDLNGIYGNMLNAIA